ncbi:PepSY-associated TM helix domain-containing protein [Celerinatantimonas sp. MCCC 1A17872]|uniref:PepSY-associated TM helix domain-containing protein n=1 Tax=Celerinatantimonas sp. MCCC 1A17872 TaxID=3177514 RepID=UPI0038C6C292
MKGNRSQGTYLGIFALIKRLHFYIGLFVGPFIFIAALTGTLYALAPQLEAHLYQYALRTTSHGEPQSLQNQIKAARQSLSQPLKLYAVRPSIGDGYTTRVLFSDPKYRLQHQTVFVDPVTLAINATLPTYGTSGVLPLMTTLDFIHRGLLLGNAGRVYSEMAASWMWIAALGGVALWYCSKQKNKKKTKSVYVKARNRHQKTGLIILIGLLFFSATGLTWSQWAGGNIAKLRRDIGWVTPSPNMTLPKALTGSPSVKNTSVDALFDPVLHLARASGLEAKKIEIRPSYNPTKGWFVREIHRAWPTQVDSLSVDPNTMTVTSRADFKNYPIIAKLIRWGIDFHMGILFGIANQLLLAAFGLTLCFMIILGYVMWWKRRPSMASEKETISYIWAHLTLKSRLITLVIAFALGIALPVLGCSLLLFMIVDLLRWKILARNIRFPLNNQA